MLNIINPKYNKEITQFIEDLLEQLKTNISNSESNLKTQTENIELLNQLDKVENIEEAVKLGAAIKLMNKNNKELNQLNLVRVCVKAASDTKKLIEFSESEQNDLASYYYNFAYKLLEKNSIKFSNIELIKLLLS
jgi:hypothetical protein